MLLYILLITVFIIFLNFRIDYLYFEPASKRKIENFNKTNPPYPCIRVGSHYAIYKKGTNFDKVLIIAHGNAGSFLDRDYLIDKLSSYSGDIYLFEYPGFSGLKGKATINSCVNEIMFWIKYLKPKYKKIDLFGESIGGGLIIETCVKHSLNFINKIYLQSTFTSMKDVIYDMNYGLYLFYNLLLFDDLNTSKSLKKIQCEKFVIIHSKDDKLINYSQSQKNFRILQNLNKKVKFIEGSGSHGNTLFEL